MDENELDPVDPRPADAASEAAERAALEAERQAGIERARAQALALARARAALAGRRVLVAGLGESGFAIARWAASKGASVVVADSREAPPQLEALRTACPEARFVGGGLAPALLDGVDLVGWSQGLSPIVGAAAALHAAALEAGLPVWGELEFFAREIAVLRAEGRDTRVVAITGTNGKTTTTRLVGHLCREAGLRVAVCGNISPAALDALREAVEHDDLPQVWVIEAASYQLWLAESFAPDCATVLNVTQDHLDWHGTMVDYLAAKQRIYAPGTVCVVNRDDPLSAPGATLPADGTDVGEEAAAAPGDGLPEGASKAERLAARRAAARVAKAEAEAKAVAEAARVVLTFGLDAPTAAPGFGIVRDGGLAWLAEAVPDEDAMPSGRRRRAAAAPFRVKRLMPADALRIRGAHNQANALAALALSRAVGVPMAAMLHGLRAFRGEPHRCELVALIRDVEWYDDSKGTNVGATVAALTGLGKSAVLIAGGEGKGQDFSPLALPVAAHAAAVLLIGRDAPAIRAALEESGVPLLDCASLEEAVAEASRIAKPGQAVLLSPACASFDMFRNYGHRAQVFVDAVRRVAEEDGQPC
ncbi:MAG: UDP-N-acetylmuramoyl-L-alanine--D-glutamate ligase [Burkholderiaceae bacterium]|nr:UDP-N-acetylmuramoyl-L-alanine--D-glutamate ligase [Burkholderiales bacterium]MCZ8336813.1 UDP-N-acetylmuramoyl-L-alanine--D-glutamate ligase [Burkholderiaceae bacterium]